MASCSAERIAEQEEQVFDQVLEDLYVSRSACPTFFLCFQCPLPSLGGTARWSRLRADCDGEKWWAKRCRRAKEALIESAVGAKWRALVRKIRLQKNHHRRRKPVCSYDPLSYAMNFDDGIERGGEDSDRIDPPRIGENCAS